MKVMITGITGMVGSHLADYLLDKAEVHGAIRVRSRTENIEHLENKVKLHNVDLTDPIAVNNVIHDYDQVYHLAAQSDVMYSFKNPAETLRNNIFSTLNILEASKNNAKTLICSSSEVYGNTRRYIAPESPYAVSKATIDLLAQVYRNANKQNIHITRAFSHTGPRRGNNFAESSFAYQIAMIEKNMLSPVIYHGNLDSTRTYMDVRDLVKAYHLLLTKDCPYEVYDIGGDETVSMKRVLDRLLCMSDKEIRHKEDENLLRPIDVMYQKPDSSRFREVTKWKPTIKLSQTLTDLLNYWRERV